MPRKGENIYKRKDGRWEGRYVKSKEKMVGGKDGTLKDAIKTEKLYMDMFMPRVTGN